MKSKDINKKIITLLRKFAGSKLGIVVLILWAFFESSFWFIAPDVILFLLAFSSPKKYKKFFFITCIFATLGTIFYFIMNILYPVKMTQILLLTPLITEKMFPFLENLYAS